MAHGGCISEHNGLRVFSETAVSREISVVYDVCIYRPPLSFSIEAFLYHHRGVFGHVPTLHMLELLV